MKHRMKFLIFLSGACLKIPVFIRISRKVQNEGLPKNSNQTNICWSCFKNLVFINIFNPRPLYYGPPYQGRTWTNPENLNRISIINRLFPTFMGLTSLLFLGALQIKALANPQTAQSQRMANPQTKSQMLAKSSTAQTQMLAKSKKAESPKSATAPSKSLSESQKSLKTIILSEEDFLKQVLSSSLYLTKIQNQQKKALSQILYQKYSFYDWGLSGGWKHEKQNNSDIDPFLPKQKTAKTSNLSLQKQWPYGLQFRSSYLDIHEANIDSELLQPFGRPTNIYRKQLRLELSHNMTTAFTHPWLFKSFKLSLSLNELMALEQTEDLALKALEQYWKSYRAYIALKQAQEGLKVYQKLVSQTNNKKKYNFLQPGERPQVLAEYQNIQKTAEQSQQNYEKEKKALLVFLKQDPSYLYELDFKDKALKPPLPLTKIPIKQTRSLIIPNQQLKSQKFQMVLHKSTVFPSVELVGARGWTPIGESSQLEFSSDLSFYEFALQLKWVLFSKSAYENIRQKKYELEESKIDLALFKHQLKNQLALLEKQIPLSYKNIERAKKANLYYKQAFKEIQQSFEQGRVDIFQLIQIEKQIRSSELEKAKALSEYSLSVAQLLALKDKLLEKYQP